MDRRFQSFLLLLVASVLFLTGCATTRARKQDPTVEDLTNQVAQLQNELQAKDQQIQALQYQADNVSNVSTRSAGESRSSIIRVQGVTVKDVQRALQREGFDPGPVDGRAGKKTKSAIKRFQRSNNLKADGIVGERTWSYLKS